MFSLLPILSVLQTMYIRLYLLRVADSWTCGAIGAVHVVLVGGKPSRTVSYR